MNFPEMQVPGALIPGYYTRTNPRRGIDQQKLFCFVVSPTHVALYPVDHDGITYATDRPPEFIGTLSLLWRCVAAGQMIHHEVEMGTSQ